MQLSTVLNLNGHLDLKSLGKWVLCTTLVGVVSGLGAALFMYLLGLCKDLFLSYMANYYPPQPGGEANGFLPVIGDVRLWALALVPALGGLISGAIIYTWAPEAEGHGTDGAVGAFHRARGMIRKRVPLIKTIASTITIGSGGSAGREGPIAQIGAGFGSYLATKLNLSDRERRIMLIAGVAGGIGSIFRAPLGGALFACEVLYRKSELESEAIFSAIVSSIVGYSIFTSFFGWGAIFDTPGFQFRHPIELLFYAVLGVVCAGVGLLYIKVFYGMRDQFFRRLRVPNHFKPAIGGLLLGGLLLLYPQVMAGGYGWIQKAMFGQLAIRLMIALVFAKILATAFTISSGGSGGVFAPSLFIGAMLGGAFGQICHSIFPGIITEPASFVPVCMGGFFAGVAKVPLCSVIMICEMTGNYGLLVPLMLVSVVAFLLSDRWSLYEEQVPFRVDSPAHFGDFAIDVLEDISVANVPRRNDFVTINEHTPLGKIVRLFSETTHSYFPVVDDEGKMTGILSFDDVRNVLNEDILSNLVLAEEIATKDAITVKPSESLSSVLRKFTLKNLEELPVVAEDDDRNVIGMFTRKDLIHAYLERMKHVRLNSVSPAD